MLIVIKLMEPDVLRLRRLLSAMSRAVNRLTLSSASTRLLLGGAAAAVKLRNFS